MPVPTKPTTPAASTTPPTPKRHRSPNYPAIDLQTAIGKAQTFYNSQKRNAIPSTVATQTLGYSAKNSEGKRVLSALVSFGLFEEETANNGRQVRISPLALNIFRHDKQPALRLPYLQDAAIKPPIYADMVDKWPDALPSDLAIAEYLEYDRTYNPSTIKALIRKFRATYEFAQLGDRVADPPAQPEEEEEATNAATSSAPPVAQTTPVAAPQEAVEAETEQGAVKTPPGGESKSSRPNATPADEREEEKFIVPLLAGRRLVVRYPKVLAESEVQMVESALAMIRAAIGAG